MLVRISVSADFEKRLDNQWEVEREIQADRWSWEWAHPKPSPFVFHLDQKLDELKPGQWWLWSCTAEMSDGTEKRGTVQSDGHMIAKETWQEDDV